MIVGQPPSDAGQLRAAVHACQMDESLGGDAAGLAAAIVLHFLVILAINPLSILALMREQRGFLLFPHAAHVYVAGGMKAHRLRA